MSQSWLACFQKLSGLAMRALSMLHKSFLILTHQAMILPSAILYIEDNFTCDLGAIWCEQAQGLLTHLGEASKNVQNLGLVRSVLAASLYPQFGQIVQTPQRQQRLLIASKEKARFKALIWVSWPYCYLSWIAECIPRLNCWLIAMAKITAMQ